MGFPETGQLFYSRPLSIYHAELGVVRQQQCVTSLRQQRPLTLISPLEMETSRSAGNTDVLCPFNQQILNSDTDLLGKAKTI